MKEPLVSAILAKNEAGRYLPEVLDTCGKFGGIVVLDDGSTDGTRELCEAHPAVVCYRLRESAREAWGAEASAREELWRLASEYGRWCLFTDADQLFVGDPRPLARTTLANAWAFPLYDLWGDRTHYRSDGHWRGHDHPRIWMVDFASTPGGWEPEWGPRGVHVGHVAPNFPAHPLVGPPSTFWLHLGYIRAEDRAAKLQRYRSVGGQLTEFERAHAESIADERPVVRVLPSHKPIKVLVGGPVRKRLDVLKAHLQTVAWQDLPPRVEVSYCFVPDYENEQDAAFQYLAEWTAERKGVLLKGAPRTPDDFADAGVDTHKWTDTAMGRVGANKNLILRHAVQNGFDWVWLNDSDLILDPYVLRSLLDTKQALASAVYWTRWNKVPKMHSGPQVWLRHVYEPFQSGRTARGQTEGEFRQKLVSRNLTRVWGLGACTLVARSVIEKGVGFHRFPGLPSGGLWDGEDRHFCSWAEHLHVPMYADPWPDIFHVYHDDDVARVPEFLERLSEGRGFKPLLGELASVRLTPLEEPAGLSELVRLRLGDNSVLPDIEATLTTMTRGDTRIIRAQFPASYPFEALRGKQRLLEVTLCDHKPFGFPPVLEEEMFATPVGYADATGYSPEQHAALQEDL